MKAVNKFYDRNYFKVALRYLMKHKGYTVINVSGLAVGIASCMLIMLFVKSESSFDRLHTKADRLCRAWLQEQYQGQVFTNTVTPVGADSFSGRSTCCCHGLAYCKFSCGKSRIGEPREKFANRIILHPCCKPVGT